MVGQRGLKILLVWAWIIDLAVCQTTATTPDNSQWSSATILTSSVPPPQCSYTVTPIKFGFQFNFTSSAAGDYTITINEEGQYTTSLQLSDQTKSHEIKQLKPCTEYEHHVTFTVGPDTINCINSDGHKTKTSQMNKADIKVSSCKPGYVCYQSDWNIGSSLSTPNNIPAHQCQKKTFCVKPGSNDICSDFTTSFTCGKFSFTKSITVDFLDETTINQPVPTDLPAKINPQLPPNCKKLAIDYICQENLNPAEQKKLSELEPYTDYTCTGLIKNNSVPIKNTTAIKFNIDCGLTITNTTNSTTSTSIELSWNTASQKCRNVLSNLTKLSYECSCRSTDSNQQTTGKTLGETNGGRCKISGLKPYTDYTCDIQPTYNNKKVNKQPEVKLKTDPGRPDQIPKLNVNVSEHNVIKVTCDRAKNLNGPKERYIIRLRYAGGTDVVSLQNITKCKTEFKDLSYLTKYTVEVIVFNGIFESEPKTKDVSTLYNDKAVIGFLVFLIIVIFVASPGIGLYLCKKRRDELMLQSTAIYVNARPFLHHHEETK